jgi:hypothetical protein
MCDLAEAARHWKWTVPSSRQAHPCEISSSSLASPLPSRQTQHRGPLASLAAPDVNRRCADSQQASRANVRVGTACCWQRHQAPCTRAASQLDSAGACIAEATRREGARVRITGRVSGRGKAGHHGCTPGGPSTFEERPYQRLRPWRRSLRGDLRGPGSVVVVAVSWVADLFRLLLLRGFRARGNGCPDNGTVQLHSEDWLMPTLALNSDTLEIASQHCMGQQCVLKCLNDSASLRMQQLRRVASRAT